MENRSNSHTSLVCILVVTLMSVSCNKWRNNTSTTPTEGAHNHPNNAEGTHQAVAEIVEVQIDALAASKPVNAEEEAQVCREEYKAFTAAKGSPQVAHANMTLLKCTSKITNEALCKGKAQPCGTVYYIPPTVQGQSQPDPQAVDVSVPDAISKSCAVIGAAAGLMGTGVDPLVGVKFGSAVGEYSCGAWFKAAAKHDPTLLITPMWVPSEQMLKDLNILDGKKVADDAVKTAVQTAQHSFLYLNIGGAQVPLSTLPIVAVGGTPGQALDQMQKGVTQTVDKTTKEIGNALKDVGGKVQELFHR